MSEDTPAPRRSDATKAAILAAAREQFAASGYQAATIRAIAAAAGIDPAMVMRYFGNKEGLFAAAAEFDLRLPDLGGAAAQRRSAPALVGALPRSLGGRRDADGPAARPPSPTRRRPSACRPSSRRRWRRSIARLSGEPRAAAAARAGLIATQMLGLALCRYVLKLPPVVGAQARRDRAPRRRDRAGLSVRRLIRLRSAHLEHELAAQVPAFAHPVRRGRLRQRVDLDLRHAHGAAW